MTACSRYGFAAPSGSRISKRPLPGTRTMCVRLLPVHVTVFGDHVAPESVRGALMRLYEFTVGLVIAAMPSACFMIPPRKLYPCADRPISSALSRNIFCVPLLSHTDICTWHPLPVRLVNGFGMNVARSPCFSATDFVMNLKNEWRSAVRSASSKFQFISNWPFASSWSF